MGKRRGFQPKFSTTTRRISQERICKRLGTGPACNWRFCRCVHASRNVYRIKCTQPIVFGRRRGGGAKRIIIRELIAARILIPPAWINRRLTFFSVRLEKFKRRNGWNFDGIRKDIRYPDERSNERRFLFFLSFSPILFQSGTKYHPFVNLKFHRAYTYFSKENKFPPGHTINRNER